MARDCPQNQSAGKGYPDQNGGYGRGGIRALHGLTEVMPEDDEEVKEWTIPVATPANVDKSDDVMKLTASQSPDGYPEPPPTPQTAWQVKKSRAAQKKERRILGEAKCQDECCRLGILETIDDHEEVNTVGEWEEIMITVDSGASETVIGEVQAKTIPTTKGNKSGVKYALANGELVDNEGEKNMVICSIEGVSRSITAQVTEVNIPLLGVSKMVKAGYTVTFSPDGSHIYDGYTGETMSLEEKNGLFMLKGWVQPSVGFQGLGASP